MNDASIGETITGLSSVLSELAASYLEPALKEYGLGFGSFDLLSAVRATEGKSTQTAIARRMGISSPSLTEAIKSASRRGLIEQRIVDNDLRAKCVRLTPKGNQILDRCLALLHEAECALVEGLSTAEVETARRVLKHGIQVVLQLQRPTQ